MTEGYIQRQATQKALTNSKDTKSCKNCYWDWVIKDTLDASEGEVDLSADYCFNCSNFSNWKELRRGKDENDWRSYYLPHA